MNDAITAALAVIAAAIVAGITGWLTARASAKGSVKAAQVTSLADLEREAGQRASVIYQGVIKQLEVEAAQDRAEIDALRVRVTNAETALSECKKTCRALARRMDPKD